MRVSIDVAISKDTQHIDLVIQPKKKKEVFLWSLEIKEAKFLYAELRDRLRKLKAIKENQ